MLQKVPAGRRRFFRRRIPAEAAKSRHGEIAWNPL
jgi:hypothetical protein